MPVCMQLIGFCRTTECISFLITSAVFVLSTIVLLGCVLYFLVRICKRPPIPHPEYEEIPARAQREDGFNDDDDDGRMNNDQQN